jgi:glycosyltransferase involved in cell wall biosynthesis
MEPSKLYGAMAAGRPVLYIGPEGTEVARTVREERIGEVVGNGDVEKTRQAIEHLDSAPIGERARAILERDYGRQRRSADMARVLSMPTRGI